MNVLSVTTVPAATVPAGKLQITATTRATKGKEIADADRSRSIIVDEYTPNVADKYVLLVSSALASLAKDQLAALWKESDPREVDASLFLEDSLLAYSQREAESKKLTKEVIADWWKASQFRLFCEKKFGAKASHILARLQNLSAPKPDYTEDQALQAIALFGAIELEEGDEIAPRLVAKLQDIVDKIRATREAIESSNIPF